MTDPGGAGPPATDLTNLVEALDRRARQAGTEGASTVLRGMVGTITEVLGGLEQRLDRIEGGIADAHGAGASEVQGSLAGLHDRLGRLEEAFVQAVESSAAGSDALLAEIRAAIEASTPDLPAPIDVGRELESAVRETRSAVAETVAGIDGRLSQLAEGIARLDERVASAETGSDKPNDDGEMLAGLAHLADVVRSLEARMERADQSRNDDQGRRALQESLVAVQTELSRLGARLGDGPRDERALAAIGELRAAWETGHDRLDRVVGAVRAAVEGEASGAAGTRDLATASQLRQLEAAIERLARNDSAGRLVGLVEARLSTGLDAMVARADSAADASARVSDAVEAATRRVAETAHAVEQLTAAVESLGARVERETSVAIEGVGSRIADRLDRIADQQSRDTEVAHDALRSEIGKVSVEIGKVSAEVAERTAGTGEAAAAKVAEALQREAELLTQRIAVLARGVDGLRTMLEDHLRRTENTFGRKAGEMGRRLAVDFGLRAQPRDEDTGPSRELGRGG